MNNNLIIRDYEPSDYEQVIEVWNETDMAETHRKDDKVVIERTINHGGKLIVLEDVTNNIIIGTSWLTNDGRRIYLHHFGIKPDFQGKGHAHLLLKESLAFARETGLQIKLEVHRSNVKATEFYKNEGFKYLGDYDIYIIRDLN